MTTLNYKELELDYNEVEKDLEIIFSQPGMDPKDFLITSNGKNGDDNSKIKEALIKTPRRKIEIFSSNGHKRSNGNNGSVLLLKKVQKIIEPPRPIHLPDFLKKRNEKKPTNPLAKNLDTKLLDYPLPERTKPVDFRKLISLEGHTLPTSPEVIALPYEGKTKERIEEKVQGKIKPKTKPLIETRNPEVLKSKYDSTSNLISKNRKKAYYLAIGIVIGAIIGGFSGRLFGNYNLKRVHNFYKKNKALKMGLFEQYQTTKKLKSKNSQLKFENLEYRKTMEVSCTYAAHHDNKEKFAKTLKRLRKEGLYDKTRTGRKNWRAEYNEVIRNSDNYARSAARSLNKVCGHKNPKFRSMGQVIK